MSKWIKGDLHTHSIRCRDGAVTVDEIARISSKYCDFIAISGHAEDEPGWSKAQYEDILAAREKYPDMPIFHSAEQEFPIPRHCMFFVLPENREYELQEELAELFDRRQGIVGIDKAVEELKYVEKHWGDDAFMVFNHPNAPDLSLEDFLALAEANDVFKVIACLDRGERRAPQVWDVNAEWDKVLAKGHRIYARCGSDFHNHFNDGGVDYYPGEFVQDYLKVKENTYEEIIKAYKNGNFYCCVDNCIENPCFEISKCSAGSDKYNLKLQLKAKQHFEFIEIISDCKVVASFNGIKGDFSFEGTLPGKTYFRVRGKAEDKARKYSEGFFEPVFLLNPIFTEDC